MLRPKNLNKDVVDDLAASGAVESTAAVPHAGESATPAAGGDLPDPRHQQPSTSLSGMELLSTGQHPSPGLGSLPNPAVMSTSILEGANDFTLNSPVFNTVAGNLNSTVFRFDGSECSC